MTAIQIILIIISLFLLLIGRYLKKSKKINNLLLVLIGCSALFVIAGVIFPSMLQSLGETVGLSKGGDLVVYL